MAIGSGNSRGEGGGGLRDVHINVSPDAPRSPHRIRVPAAAAPAAEKSELERLFESLNGEDAINVHRITVEDGEKYIGRMHMEPGLFDNLEGAVAERFGGGRYRLIGRRKSQTTCSAIIHIDEQQWPPKSRAQVKAEQAPAAPAPPAAPAVDVPALLRYFEERDERRWERTERLLQQQRTPSSGAEVVMPFVTSMLDKQMELTRSMIGAGAPHPVAPASGAGEFAQHLKSFTDIADAMGWQKPGSGAGESNPVRSLGEQAVLRIVDKAGDVMVKKIEKEWDKPGEKAPAAAPAQQAQLPAAGTQVARIPAEAKPLGSEALERLRRSSLFANRQPAPSAADVMAKGK